MNGTSLVEAAVLLIDLCVLGFFLFIPDAIDTPMGTVFLLAAGVCCAAYVFRPAVSLLAPGIFGPGDENEEL
jgi:threonine/homoserine efflux transporter RhtA